ncbi:hypothetical protein BDQ17DRAFT_230702 [Cyathus striatus]|nr:hypothetical protein BDQ17DRAFT_230702 [Cyathus striatus]
MRYLHLTQSLLTLLWNLKYVTVFHSMAIGLGTMSALRVDIKHHAINCPFINENDKRIPMLSLYYKSLKPMFSVMLNRAAFIVGINVGISLSL